MSMSLPAFLKSHGRPWLLPVVVSAFVLAAMVLMSGAKPASAANAGVAPPLVEHCNDSGATAGMELRCTIEIINYLNADGTLASSPASTVTITVCEAAESAGTAPCAAPITTTSLVPLTTARQCNAAYHGGGSWIECRVSIINYWATAPATVAATIFQCSGSVILGPGAPGSCDPLEAANTAASTATATIGQCNDSGYGGGTPVGGFVCTISLSTTTALLPMHVDQCNDSGYGGGTVVRCSTRILNLITPAPVPAPPPPAPAEPFVQTYTLVCYEGETILIRDGDWLLYPGFTFGECLVAATPTPTATPVPTAAPTAAPTASPTALPVAVPTPLPVTPLPPALQIVPSPIVPSPAGTGNTAPLNADRSVAWVLWLGSIILVGLVSIGARSVTRRYVPQSRHHRDE